MSLFSPHTFWSVTGKQILYIYYNIYRISLHLSYSIIFQDISKTPINPKDDMILTIITYLGCGLSSIFLGITLLTYVAFE